MADFVHLHNHTAYSILDGAQSPQQLAQRVKDLGMKAVACTDHGYVYGWPHFQRACKAVGIQPILGVEAYFVPDVAEAKANKSSRRFHQLLLVKNEEGFKNLKRLMSWAAIKAADDEGGFYHRPLIDFKRLDQFGDGLVVTSSCMSSYFARTLLGHPGTPGEGQTEAVRREEAGRILEWFKNRFGDDFYLEAHRHGIEEEDVIASSLPYYADKYGLEIITANDCHYAESEGFYLQDALVCMGTNKYITDKERMQIAHRNLHVKSGEEMFKLFPEFGRAPEVTMEIADKCNYEMRFPGEEGDYQFPQFPLPQGFTSTSDHLSHLVWNQWGERYPRISSDKDYKEMVELRLRYELGTIIEMGFEEYFLIVQDITSYAREAGVRVGPGRGSAAGSAVSYVLGITDIEPIAHGLIFERFLNKERVSMPDIDLDFADKGRQEVIDFIVRRYGEDRVCQIVTFSTLGARSGIRDFGRVLQVPLAETLTLTKKIPDDPKIAAKRLDELAESIPELKSLVQSEGDRRMMYDYTVQAHNFPRHTGVHAAGVVITPGPTEEYVPKATHKGTVTTQWDGSLLDSLGLTKMDILGLKTLTTIDNTVALIRDREPDFDESPMWAPKDGGDPDPEVFKTVFRPAKTIGVFQLESPGMRRYIRELKPDAFGDIVAMTSLYRPGPMDLIPSYIDRKQGREDVEYPHESLEPILEETYGIPVYQEQVMQMAQVMAGYTLGQADLLRRAMGKKKKSEMDKQRTMFVEGATKKGVSEAKANEVFDMMATFAGYGFNKSHAAAYSLLSYALGWLLTHYPVQYFAATLNDAKNDEIQMFVQEANNMGIVVAPPNVNTSQEEFTVEEDPNSAHGLKVRYGLSKIKSVGKEAEKIIKKRPKAGYASYEDLMTRTLLKKNVAQALIMCGAFDEIDPHSRATLYGDVEKRLAYLRKVRDKSRGIRKSDPNYVPIEEMPDWGKRKQLFMEYEWAGTFLTGHPLGAFRVLSEAYPSEYTIEVGGQEVRPLLGTIINSDQVITRRGNPMWFLEVLTETGPRKVTVFERTFKKFAVNLTLEKNVLMFVGEWNGEWSTLEGVVSAEQALSDWLEVIQLVVPNDEVERQAIEYLVNCSHIRGGTDIWIRRANGDEFQTWLWSDPDMGVSLTAKNLEHLSSLGITFHAY